MKIEDIDQKVKEYIGFDGLGFYEYSHQNRIYVMLKNEGEAIYRIRYEFHPKAGLDDLKFNWTIYDIIFPVVNQILKQALGDTTYTDPANEPLLSGPYEITVQEASENFQAMRKALGNSISFIENGGYHEDRLIEACALQREGIERFMLPFFQNFSTLQAVNDQLIDTIPWEDLSTRISGQTPLKRMILMKLCENPAYQDFADMFEKRMLAAVERGRRECESYYSAVGALKTYLKLGKYKTLTGE